MVRRGDVAARPTGARLQPPGMWEKQALPRYLPYIWRRASHSWLAGRPRTFSASIIHTNSDCACVLVLGSRNIHIESTQARPVVCSPLCYQRQRKIMADITCPPAKRRKCVDPLKSGISHQIYDQGRAPTAQQRSLPWDPRPQPRETDSHFVLLGGVSSVSHWTGDDSRQAQPVAAGHTSGLTLPSPPPEVDQFGMPSSPETAPFPPTAIATWTQGLPFTGVPPLGQPGELVTQSFSHPDSFESFTSSGHRLSDVPNGRRPTYTDARQ